MSLLQTNRVRLSAHWLMMLAVSFGLSLIFAFIPLLPSAAVSVGEVPNPQEMNGLWVVDMADMLSDRTEAELNQMIAALEASNGAEIAVVTVPDTQPSSSPKAFATELFNTWEIGKEGADNGVLFLISKGDRRNEIETGYGVEGILTDARLGSILDKRVTPKFKAGNFDAGVLAGTEAMIGLLNGEAFIEEAFSPLARVTDYTSWIFDGFWLALGAIALTTKTSLNRLGKTHKNAVKILPTGRENVQSTGLFLGSLLVWVLRGLVGHEVSTVKGLSTAVPKYNGVVGNVFNLVTSFESENSRIMPFVSDKLSRDVVKSGWKLFGLGFGITVITTLVFPEQKWGIVLWAWLWLGYELWVNNSTSYLFDSPSFNRETLSKSSGALVLRSDIKSPIGQRIQQTARQWAVISLNIALVLFCFLILLRLLGFWLWPYVSTAMLFACAGVFRLVRSLPNYPAVICQTCEDTMQKLSPTQLQQHLRQAEKVEIQLKNKHYGGWSCPTCSTQIDPDTLSVHLFYRPLYRAGYEDCFSCKARTVEVTNTTLIQATRSSTGKRRIIRHCHCCEKHTEKDTTMPKIKAAPRSSGTSSASIDSYSSPSSSSGGGYSGDYSGSSDGGGSFGGGSSGGGGAGSDW